MIAINVSPLYCFVIRDAPNESTQFPPFEWIFGHKVRGSLELIQETLVGPNSEIPQLDYLSEVRESLNREG